MEHDTTWKNNVLFPKYSSIYFWLAVIVSQVWDSVYCTAINIHSNFFRYYFVCSFVIFRAWAVKPFSSNTSFPRQFIGTGLLRSQKTDIILIRACVLLSPSEQETPHGMRCHSLCGAHWAEGRFSERSGFEASNLSLCECTIDGFEFPTIYLHYRVFLEENSNRNIMVHLAILAVLAWLKNLKQFVKQNCAADFSPLMTKVWSRTSLTVFAVAV